MTNEETVNEDWKGALAGGMLAASTLAGLPQDAEAKSHRHHHHRNLSHIQSNISPVEAVAKTLWGEARGEGFDGINDIASVILNRAKNNPQNFIKVITKPKQFSVWNNGTPQVYIRNENDQKIWDYCQKIASDMVANKFKPTHNWSHYYNPKKVKTTPRWAKNVPYEDRGSHRFLKV